MACSLLLAMKRFIRGLMLWVKGIHSLNYILAYTFYRHLPKIFRSVVLPNNIKIYVNDEATLSINVPDIYERKEYFLREEFVPKRGWTVVDIGAYVGIFSLYASKAVGDEGLVLSFEPNPLAYYWLLNNIKLNKANNIIVLPIALGDTPGKMQLYVAKENIGASSLIAEHVLQNPAGKYTVADKFYVPITTLDQFLEESERYANKPIKNLDLVKIDVEGYELKVLEGAEKTLRERLIKRLIIEVHVDQVQTETIMRHLKKHGFHVVGIKHFGGVKDIIYLNLKEPKRIC